jgi:hypothetical protein
MDRIHLRRCNRAVMGNRAMPVPLSNANESDNEGSEHEHLPDALEAARW